MWDAENKTLETFSLERVMWNMPLKLSAFSIFALYT
jgi:hypothetical protein